MCEPATELSSMPAAWVSVFLLCVPLTPYYCHVTTVSQTQTTVPTVSCQPEISRKTDLEAEEKRAWIGEELWPGGAIVPGVGRPNHGRGA